MNKLQCVATRFLIISSLAGCGLAGVPGLTNSPLQDRGVLNKYLNTSYDTVAIPTTSSEDLHGRITRLRFEAAMNKSLSKEKAAELTEIRAELIKRNASWPKKIKAAIKNGNIINGMNFEQVKASYGEPTLTYSVDGDSFAHRPDVVAQTKEYLAGKKIDTWSWQGNSQSYYSEGSRYYDQYTFGTVTFQNGVVTQSSPTK